TDRSGVLSHGMPNREDVARWLLKSRRWPTKSSQFRQAFQTMQFRMNPMPSLDYLVIAAHPDDAEIGAGGALVALKAQGAHVGVLDLTNGEPTRHGTPEIRSKETA